MAETPGILLLNAEDNDLSGLTITEEGSNDLTISSGAALHGSLGYNFAFSGNTGENLLYFYKSFTSGTDIYARCYFYISSTFSMNAADFAILSLMSSAAEGTYLLRPTCTYSSGNLKIYRVYYRTNSGTAYIDVNVTLTRDTSHYLEIRYKSDASAGIIDCYLDGTSIASATSLATSTYTSGYVRLGNDQGGVPTSGSKIYVDDIKVNSSYIGAYADSGGALPAIINNYRQQGVM